MSEERAKRIKSWLMRSPRPDFVRVASADGESRDVHLGPAPRWINIARTVEALDPTTVEAIKGDQVLRAENFGEAGAVVEAPERDDDLPETPAALLNDPETARFTHVANLLYRSSRDSRDALVAVVKILETMAQRETQRADNNRERYEREVLERMEDMMDAVEAASSNSEGTGPEGILGALANGLAQGQAKNGSPPKRRKADN
jgi:hypothetical protein